MSPNHPTLSIVMILNRRHCLSVLVAGASVCACGGGEDSTWDEFRPRTAQPTDLQNRSFLFTGFRYGAVFDPSWSATTVTLAFGNASAATAPATLPAMVTTADGSSSGTATLAGDTLTLVLAEPAARHPFQRGQTLVYTLSADVDDGRIRLLNRASGEEQTSAPGA